MNARRPALFLTLVLAGCATYVPQPAPVVVATKPAATPPSPIVAPTVPAALPPAKPEQIPQQFGGYYQDDGPIMQVPYDLDALAEPDPVYEPLNNFANKPYSVLGKTYLPRKTLGDFIQEGVASWYGKKFHGKRTSSGEIYDLFKLTAAHPTLPIPSYARVTSLVNGKSVVVKINDRGPFHSARIIDLSYAAAYRLGYQNAGSAKVRVEALLPGEAKLASNPVTNLVKAVEAAPGKLPDTPVMAAIPNDTPDALAQLAEAVDLPPVKAVPIESTGEVRWVQLGAFSAKAAAEAFAVKIADRVADLSAPPSVAAGGAVWRVRIGPFVSLQAARDAAERIAAKADLKPVVMR